MSTSAGSDGRMTGQARPPATATPTGEALPPGEAATPHDGDASSPPAAASPPATSGLTRDALILVRAARRLDRTRFLLLIALLLANGVLGGVSLLLLIPIVNSIADPSSQLTVPLLGEVRLSEVPLPLLLAGFVGLTVLTALMSRAATINAQAIQTRIVDALRQEAFTALLRARWEFVVGRQKSDIIEIVTTGASRSGQAFSQLVQVSVTAVLFVVTALVALLISPMVAAICLLGVVLLGLAQGRAVLPAYRMGRTFGERNRALQSVMTDSMDSLRLIRAHNAHEGWAEELAGAFRDTREVQVANVRRNATVSAMSTIGLAVAASALVLLAVWAKVPPAGIVVMLLLVARLARNAQTMATNAAQLANALPAVGDLTRLTADARAAVEVPLGAAAREGAIEAGGEGPVVEFRDVSYTYPNSSNGVRRISFGVSRGDITVLTGPSGSGKSTTADLALGLLAPAAGEVVVQGQALRPADLPWWRDHVAYVPQETVLIPGTLRRNLVWSVPGDVSDERCWAALDRAAATFARRLPDGLDTVLGDRGVRLSGGERQRVAIARALLREPTFLVLDEATSSLDDLTESQVLELMASLVPSVTVLVLAHRKSTVDAAHHVVRFADGEVVERVSR